MITWEKTGCMEVAALPNGWTATIRTTIDSLCRKPVHVTLYDERHSIVRDYWATEVAEVKREIEQIYSPKPLATGPGWSVWVSNDKKRSAYAKCGTLKWMVFYSGIFSSEHDTREAAEAAAAKYVRGEA